MQEASSCTTYLGVRRRPPPLAATDHPPPPFSWVAHTPPSQCASPPLEYRMSRLSRLSLDEASVLPCSAATPPSLPESPDDAPFLPSAERVQCTWMLRIYVWTDVCQLAQYVLYVASRPSRSMPFGWVPVPRMHEVYIYV